MPVMTAQEKEKAIEKLRKGINEKLGSGLIEVAAKHKGVRMVRFPTGTLGLDIPLGGGMVRNTVNIFFGKSSQGKSTLALHAIASLQEQGFTCAYIYTEGPVDYTHLKSCKVDIDKLQLTITNNFETAVNLVQTLAQSKIIDYIVVDSIQGLVSNMILERTAEERTMGTDAFMCSQLVKKFVASTTCNALEDPWCTLTLINHGAEPFGGGQLEVKGGEVQQFFSVQTVEVRAGKGLTKTGAEAEMVVNKVGHRIHFKIRKNKTFPPFKSGQINYYIGKTDFGCERGDIDHIHDTVTCGVKYGVIQQNGAWIVHNKGKKDEKKFNGSQAYADFVRTMQKKDFETLRGEILTAGLSIESNQSEHDMNFEKETDGKDQEIG